MDILSLLSADDYHSRFYPHQSPPSPPSPSPSSSSSASSCKTHINDSHPSYPSYPNPIFYNIQLNSRSESCCAAFIGLDLSKDGVVELEEQSKEEPKEESRCGFCKVERESETEWGPWYELEVETALGLVLPSPREAVRLMGSEPTSRSRSTSRSKPRGLDSIPDIPKTGSNEDRVENENENKNEDENKNADDSEHSSISPSNPHPQKRRRISTPTLSPKTKAKPPTKTKAPIPPPSQPPHTETPTPTPNPKADNQIV
ncbi:hypothetical protein IFR05_012495, partial [Cadophora sp. M221]